MFQCLYMTPLLAGNEAIGVLRFEIVLMVLFIATLTKLRRERLMLLQR